jgi:APA family basic amino acid/polyamine antiporter
VAAGKLPKALGLWRSTALVVGNMIGSGIFLLPASLAAYGGISILGWLFTSTGAMLLALVFAHLGRGLPRAGGVYAYTRAGFGDFAGFLVGWGYWISIWSGNAAIATAFVGYAGVFLPALSRSTLLSAATAAGAIWFLSGVNALGVRGAGMVQLATTILKLLPLIAVGTIGFLFFNRRYFSPFNPSGVPALSAITATATLTLWAFTGLESATIPADSVANPRRTIPRATIIGTLTAALVYILGTTAVMGVVPSATLARSTAPFADAASLMWGGWASRAVAAGAAISCFGALNGWILLQGQLPLAVARDGLFPEIFARLSKRGAPVFGIVLSSGLATVLIAMNYTRGLVEEFTFILLLATLTSLVPYVFCSAADVMMRLGGGTAKRGRRWPLAVPGLAFAYSLWAIGGAGRDTVYWGFLLLLAGIPLFVWHRLRSRRDRETGLTAPAVVSEGDFFNENNYGEE